MSEQAAVETTDAVAQRTLTGRVRAVYLRGRCVFERRRDGSELFAPAGTGTFLRRGIA